MIDSHCHLDFHEFDSDREQIIEKCLGLGIAQIIIPGTQCAKWPAIIELCKHYDCLQFALGLHPYFLSEYQSSHIDQLDALLAQHRDKVVAVGEIGLDFGKADLVDELQQRDIMTQQIELANHYRLPIIVHHRRSHNALFQLFKHTRPLYGGVIHAFSGSYQEASAYVDLGFKLGVGGTITYPRAGKTREAIQRISLDSLVLETDAPDMPVFGKQGQRNSPENLVLIAQSLAQLRAEAEALIISTTENTTRQLFTLT